MNKSTPVAWYWAGVGRRVELQRPATSNSANWKPLYLEHPAGREAQLETAINEALETLGALGDTGRVRKADLLALAERMRQMLDVREFS